MSTFIKQFINDEDGATAIEYGLIAALIAVACIAALGAVGNQLSTTFGSVSNRLSTANTPAS